MRTPIKSAVSLSARMSSLSQHLASGWTTKLKGYLIPPQDTLPIWGAAILRSRRGALMSFSATAAVSSVSNNVHTVLVGRPKIQNTIYTYTSYFVHLISSAVLGIQVLSFSTEYAECATLLGRIYSRKQPWFHVKELERD
jgi:hypothetical protein